ncbi:hypothetical protein GC197_08760 [bacterium]|nr:hypothetical protein [bacterium]
MPLFRLPTMVPAMLLVAWQLTSGAAQAKTIHVPGDFASIQEAIDAAAPGDEVLVRPGTYAQRLVMAPGITVKSEGDDTPGERGLKRAAATILDGSKVAGAGVAVMMAEGSTLDGFTIQNFGVYDDAAWNHHYETQGNEQSHEHIGQSPAPGIQIPDVTCEVTNNIVHHIGDTGIGLFGSPGSVAVPHVYRNICYRNMGGGIGAMKQSRALIEENTCFENFYAGIGHSHASPTVLNNTCFDNIRAGIGISEGSCPIVRGNACYKNRRAGIGTRTGSTTRPIIEGNKCYANEMAGIGTEEDASPTIRNNECYQNKLAGIGVRHAEATIIGNDCHQNGAAGIGLDNADAFVSENYCHENQTAGIGLADSDEGHARLVKNRVIENKLVAVGINQGWNAELIENELSRSGGLPPIINISAGASATLTGNTIRGGGVAGVRTAGKVRIDRCQFDGTSLRKVGPPNFAIWALPESSVQVMESKFDNWRHAVFATDCQVAIVSNSVKRFHQSAFVIQNAKANAPIMKNQVISSEPDAKVFTQKGDQSHSVIDRDNEISTK